MIAREITVQKWREARARGSSSTLWRRARPWPSGCRACAKKARAPCLAAAGVKSRDCVCV
eukprot:12398612-Alexandrium_andersonii.AAC.1